MSGIYVLAEHRRGEMREITWEMLGKGRELAAQSGEKLTAVLLGYQVSGFARELARCAEEVLVIEDETLKEFNGAIYQDVLAKLTGERQPTLTLIGHTAYGMELVSQPGAAVTTDCIDLRFEDGALKAVRQMYGGKVNADISFPAAQSHTVTVRSGTFLAEAEEVDSGETKTLSYHLEEPDYQKFMQYIEPPEGEVDITRADLLVSVGQGIGDKKNITLIAELAELMRGVMACSRPIVDKKWLPKERQVGISGKTVRPKVYLAIGVSGAFQHISEIKADTIIAINKDARAPIFRVADYGIVADLFTIVPELIARLKEMRTG